jgi:hypothetical protein
MSPTSGPVGSGGDAACTGDAAKAASSTATFQECLIISVTSRVR